jgi:hypothetical protein
MRIGYRENPPDAEGWRDPPSPLAITTADARLDVADGPTEGWTLATARAFLDGSLSLDQLYRYVFDLRDYRKRCYDTLDEAERERDLVFQFSDALWHMCLSAVLHDDETALRHYVPQWIPELERGGAAWRAAVEERRSPPFVDLE